MILGVKINISKKYFGIEFKDVSVKIISFSGNVEFNIQLVKNDENLGDVISLNGNTINPFSEDMRMEDIVLDGLEEYFHRKY